MRIAFATLLSAVLLAAVVAAAFIYSGIFNVAATDPHWTATRWMFEQARIRSIRTHASGIVMPKGYDTDDKLVGAVGHFSEHCAICHGGPGIKRNDIGEGMYPKPPDLTNVSARYAPGELFWILKNGIKMTGMPSMASDGDEMLWATVALLQKLPRLSPEEFNDLWMRSQGQDEHSGMHHGGATDSTAPPTHDATTPVK